MFIVYRNNSIINHSKINNITFPIAWDKNSTFNISYKFVTSIYFT